MRDEMISTGSRESAVLLRRTRRRYRNVNWTIVLVAAMHLRMAFAAAASPVDFRHDILPLLSDNCFKCHGPDEEARKAKLRLDQKTEAFRERDGIRAIVPGSRQGSELITRIFSEDPEEVMPPPKSNRKLTPNQKELFARWIDEGAPWAEHWAFVAPDRHKNDRAARRRS